MEAQLVEVMLGLARLTLRLWKAVEPYDYRLPAPFLVVEALLGVAVTDSEWLMFILSCLAFTAG
jgi:hypothetical protein